MSGISGIGFNSSYASGFFGPAFNNGGSGTVSEAAAGSVLGTDAGKVSLNPGESVEKKPGMRSSPAECETCKNRKYVDGSDENVSFKSAAHISPEAAPSRVRGHEQEHVSNAYKKAAEGDGKVLQASVKIQTAICPECGRTYVSGGLTTTQIMYKNEQNPYMKNRKSADAASGLIGSSIDAAV